VLGTASIIGLFSQTMSHEYVSVGLSEFIFIVFIVPLTMERILLGISYRVKVTIVVTLSIWC
jgi:hypothetical protein